MKNNQTLRLILGDQLNSQHSWYKTVDANVSYLLMEIRSETDYANHHIQKIIGFFAAMRAFANELSKKKHKVIYYKITDKNNRQSFEKNILNLIKENDFTHFEYQLPDEYRVDQLLKKLVNKLTITHSVCDTEHFLSTRDELGTFFKGKKTFLMESFYRHMRKKHNVLMNDDKPLTGQWNYDGDNRKKLPANHKPIAPLLFNNNVSEIVNELALTNVKSIGNIIPSQFIWPINRKQSLELLGFFVSECLPLFGTYQDAMMPNEWSIYHSRISFSLNTKMLSPLEVINAAIPTGKRRV